MSEAQSGKARSQNPITTELRPSISPALLRQAADSHYDCGIVYGVGVTYLSAEAVLDAVPDPGKALREYETALRTPNANLPEQSKRELSEMRAKACESWLRLYSYQGRMQMSKILIKAGKTQPALALLQEAQTATYGGPLDDSELAELLWRAGKKEESLAIAAKLPDYWLEMFCEHLGGGAADGGDMQTAKDLANRLKPKDRASVLSRSAAHRGRWDEAWRAIQEKFRKYRYLIKSMWLNAWPTVLAKMATDQRQRKSRNSSRSQLRA